MEIQASHHSGASTPPSVDARRVCAGCPLWQVPPGRLARRCRSDGAITIADHHCHLEARMCGAGWTAPLGRQPAAMVRDRPG